MMERLSRTRRPGIGILVAGVLAVATSTAPAQGAARPSGRPTAAGVDSVAMLATFDSAWRIVHRSLQQRNVRRVDWEGVRRELRPTAARASSDSALRVVIDGMLRRIGESHFALLPREAVGGSTAGAGTALGTAGMSVRIVGQRLLVWRVDTAGSARRAGVSAGMEIERIDDFAVPRLAVADSVGLRRLATLTGAIHALGGAVGQRVRLVVRDSGVSRELTFARDSMRVPLTRFGNLPPLPAGFQARQVALADGRCVVVIQFDYWLLPAMTALDRAMDDVRRCQGVVMDLRGNLGGIAAMMMGVAGHFVNEPVSLGTMRTGGEEMRFVVNPRRATAAGVAVEPFAGPMAIVVDGLSASTSEMFAAALQAIGRARLFGERTAGQALPAMATRLPNGDVLMHVIADFVTPNGVRVEGAGVMPDEWIPLRVNDLRAGRDAALEAALRWVEQTRPGPRSASR